MKTKTINEEWRPIAGFDKYMVSNLGRVKSFHHGKERILKPGSNGTGYLFVQLSRDGVTVAQYVHRLVCQAFLPNPENLNEANHLNRDKSDNRVDNLEWCTHQQNQAHALSKPVLQLNIDGQVLNQFDSSTVAQHQTGISRYNISCALRGKSKSAGGFVWQFA